MLNANSCYQLRNNPLIELTRSFRVLERKIMADDKISYTLFSDYYKRYFQAVGNASLGFDQVLYQETLLNCGNMLLDTEVNFENDLEEKNYNINRLDLSNFIAGYVIENGLLETKDNTTTKVNVKVNTL